MNSYKHHSSIRVRYSETDQMGYVYYGQYASYFEVARVECMRSLGLSYKSLEDQGILMPVSHFSIDYIKPCLYDDELTIETEIKEIPQARIRFYYKTFNSGGELMNEAVTELYFLDKSKMRPIRAVESLVSALKHVIK